jgi:pyruvate ferredoxin oxidoreductase alpha subunit
MTMGPIAFPNYYFEFKRQQEEAMKNALVKIQEVNEEFSKLTGRRYGDGLVEKYRIESADVVIVCVGSTAGTLKTIVDELRADGFNVGLLRLRTFRPFPVEEIRSALENVKVVGVMDKSMSFGGNGGAVYHEIRHALYDAKTHPKIIDYIYGLGGRDSSPKELRRIYEELLRISKSGVVEKQITYFGLRE